MVQSWYRLSSRMLRVQPNQEITFAVPEGSAFEVKRFNGESVELLIVEEAEAPLDNVIEFPLEPAEV